VELWTIPAEELLGAGDNGLVPWVPLTRFEGPPEQLFQRCRERIDEDAPPGEHENLLAVTQILAALRYYDPRLFQLLGGREAMIESPVLKELISERVRKDIRKVLVARFGAEAKVLETELKSVDDEGLDELVEWAATCPDLDSFRERLPRSDRQ
jgi:hypothetical protein